MNQHSKQNKLKELIANVAARGGAYPDIKAFGFSNPADFLKFCQSNAIQLPNEWLLKAREQQNNLRWRY